jgi:hypothetical protein
VTPLPMPIVEEIEIAKVLGMKNALRGDVLSVVVV